MRCYVYAIRQQYDDFACKFEEYPVVLEFEDKYYLRNFVRANHTNLLSGDDAYLKILKMVEGQSLSEKEFL